MVTLKPHVHTVHEYLPDWREFRSTATLHECLTTAEKNLSSPELLLIELQYYSSPYCINVWEEIAIGHKSLMRATV